MLFYFLGREPACNHKKPISDPLNSPRSRIALNSFSLLHFAWNTQGASRCTPNISIRRSRSQPSRSPVLLRLAKATLHRPPHRPCRLPTQRYPRISSIGSNSPPTVLIVSPSSRTKVRPTPGSSTTSTRARTRAREEARAPGAKATSQTAKRSPLSSSLVLRLRRGS